ncbi:unnamed protein product [Diamesa serratosioi]
MLLKLFLLLTVLNTLNAQSTQNATTKLALSKHDVIVIIDETVNVDLEVTGILERELIVKFFKNHEGLVQIVPDQFEVPPKTDSNGTWIQNVCILGVSPGHLEVTGNSTPVGVAEDSSLYMRVIVANSRALITISLIVGWIYFAAWSISFYPQLITNFKRKSVVGLNFDFMALNLIGHTLYAIFNVSLYWVPYIENEYFRRYPQGLNPVELNDVVFSLHASVITAITISQCFFFERGDQRVSTIARGIISVFFAIIIVTVIMASMGSLHWLDFLNYCSYIKLAITLIKYVPQAVMNFKRQSTSGWSIGNILLDFTGGTLSMLQMMLNSYNYNDWQSIFGDPTKFGLGLFSVLFDILFIVQHYVLYRDNQYIEVQGSNNEENSVVDNSEADEN